MTEDLTATNCVPRANGAKGLSGFGIPQAYKWSTLAGVRFLLASIVAINHLGDFTSLGWLGFIPKFGAFEAILGFLVISGYSICASYVKQPEGFLWRRILRLYPIYLAAILIDYAVRTGLHQPMPGLATIVINALFLNQLITASSFVGPAWSLSLEFWLYCFAPWLTRLSQSYCRLMIYVSFVTFLIYTMCRTLFHLPYYSGVGCGLNLVFLSFAWIAGFRLARAGGEDKSALRDLGVIFTGHIALDVLIQFGHRASHHALAAFVVEDTVGFAMQSATLIFLYLVFKHAVLPTGVSVRRSWTLRCLGDVSYPLYLLHASVFVIFVYWGLKNPLLLYAIAVGASALMYWLIDFYSKTRHQQIGTN